MEKNISLRLRYDLLQLHGNSCSSTSLKKSNVSSTNLRDRKQFANSVKRSVFYLNTITQTFNQYTSFNS